MTQVPTFDSRVYDAPRYRITQVGATPQGQIAADGRVSWPFGVSLYPRLRPGIAAEFSREDLLGLIGKLPAAQLLGGLFTQESLRVEAWLDSRWVVASLKPPSLTAPSESSRQPKGQSGGRPRRPERDVGLLAACLMDDHHYPAQRAERVLELMRGKPPSSIHTVASQGRKRRKGYYGGRCPLHPVPEPIRHWIDVEKRQYSDEMLTDD